jgi:acetyl-CoA C-acetyltransferase
MPGSVIVGGARTPTGRLLGSLAGFSAADLGGFAIKAALERAGISGEQVGYVVMGQVLQAGAGQIPSRQAAVKAGIPMDVPSVTINKVCLSGLDAIALADQLVRAGEFDIVVAGGMESMTNAPHLLPKSRHGYKYGSIEVLDATAHDGLTDAFEGDSMGASTERHNAKLGIERPEQDAFSARSHQRAAAAAEQGLFDAEIVPVEIPQRKGDPVVFAADEGISYTPDWREAVRRVDEGAAEVAYLVRPPAIERVFAAAERGETMPPKSTYFYPKLLSGLLFFPLGSAE